MPIKNIVIIGCNGAIGSAFIKWFEQYEPQAMLHGFSRTHLTSSRKNTIYHAINYQDEDAIKQAAISAAKGDAIDLVIVTTGVLHNDSVSPEKSLRDLSAEQFHHVFEVNTVIPALLAKHFLPHLRKHHPAKFIVLSARVGSISDNAFGGWYAYRASKAALNMVVKNTAIEYARKNKQGIIVALHPGTVDSNLSQPFQKNIPQHKLFSPDQSVEHMVKVINQLTPAHSGRIYAWDGSEIEA